MGKQMMWCKIMRYVLRGVVGLLVVLVCYGLAAWGLGQWAYHDFRANNQPSAITIYLVSNGVHTDIVMPMRNEIYDWRQDVNPKDTAGGNRTQAEYVGVGWGSRSFYLETPTWADLTPGIAFKALFGLDKSALHVTFYAAAPQIGKRVVAYRVTPQEYQKLVQSIVPSFARDDRQRSRVIANAGYGQNDAFYEANGQYSAFYTCNTWTNERLKFSGLPSVYWTPFANTLIEHYQAQPEP